MKVINVDDVLKILHKYGKYIFVTDEKRYSSMVDEIANLKALEQQSCEDCISREGLLKAFKDECRGECDNCPHFRKVDGEYKCRLIADFSSVTPKEKTGWIPVSERLPERYKEVIVTDIETSDTYLSRYIGNRYWECDNGFFKDRIIAWMPLPEPYKTESE